MELGNSLAIKCNLLTKILKCGNNSSSLWLQPQGGKDKETRGNQLRHLSKQKQTHQINKLQRPQFLICQRPFRILAVFPSSKIKYRMMPSLRVFKFELSSRSLASQPVPMPTISPGCVKINLWPLMQMQAGFYWAKDLRKFKVLNQLLAPMPEDLRLIWLLVVRNWES